MADRLLYDAANCSAMLWFIYAIGAAVGNAAKDALRKGILKDCDEYSLAFFAMALSALFLLPIALWQGIPPIGKNFLYLVVLSGVSISIAQLLILKGLKHSDLSLCSPMLTFSPAILLITSPLIIGEYPNLLGVCGVLLIVIGAYLLNISKFREGILSPFRHLARDKGPRYFLIVAVIFGISANFDKLGVNSSSPSFWVLSVNSLSAFILLIILLTRKNLKQSMRKTIGMGRYVIILGIINMIMLMLQMNAVKLAQVPYVISVKRSSAIFGVIFGALFFKEKGFRERMLGVSIMVIGVMLIAFS
jgi:uncharacterized membrane protein